MQYYFITQAVDIFYGMLCARGLADYGTEGVSLVHGRYFGEVCPANATFEISRLIGDYLVEIEAEAIIEE